MSDLGGDNGQASSSASRAAGGNVPVAQTSNPGLRTPREVMKDREAREARRRAEAERESAEQTRRDGDRRRSAERRTAAGVASASRDNSANRRSQAAPAVGGAAASSSQQPAASREGEGRTGAADPTQAGGRVQESLRTSVPASRFASNQTRANPQPTSGPRRQTAQSGLRQSSAPAASPPTATDYPSQQDDGPSDDAPKGTNTSSFPHAFERWEQLSSHWEGLTSYWLHKLETNAEEITRNVPSASVMSRQIADLSAAGANLFHAVVELQRLRASSERKFQRWFFETRGEQERTQEMQADLERRIKLEQTARADAVAEAARADQDKRNAERMVGEMRRELLISKDEARRAWEELGRREQEERDRTTSLREGMPTVVGGVQVVPMHTSAGMSLPESERRTTTSEGPPYQAQQSEGDYLEGEPSPTDTDPFTETGRTGPSVQRDEPAVQTQPYSLWNTPATSGSTAQTAIPPQQRHRAVSPISSPNPAMRAPAVTATSQAPAISGSIIQPAARGSQHTTSSRQVSPEEAPEFFYQQPSTQTYLHYSPQEPASAGQPPARAQPDLPAQHHANPQDLRSQASYAFSQASTEDTEYEIDSQGQLRRDAQGNPIVFRSAATAATQQSPSSAGVSRRPNTTSEGSDDYDVAADVAHEHELSARYGGLAAPSPPPAPASAVASPTSSSGYEAAGPADYEGQGFGGWEAVQSRHHHPTRLSDVLEEDERSRTTGE